MAIARGRSRHGMESSFSINPNYVIFPSKQKFSNDILEPRGLWENAILESYLQGVSTRKIQEIVAHLGVEKISASYVSTIAAELDQNAHLFLSRPIDTYIPYLFLDASYFKLRDGI